ncbi:MAG: CobD/CbiB family protein [Candidatus Accumulibacter sp.]|uniref:Cobalamin biosynthesis protein CobD n=1 Tax=Candidatus Accumulibacter proximus TaxID=2954385 RepID=A0A935Q394_9PROT|nr:CobD/CbiB family protein [Candidatus Accumulibacter proximus]
MSLFSLLAVLLLEQVRPLPYRRFVHEPLSSLARFLESRFNAGERHNGVVGWLIGVGGLVLVTAGIHLFLAEFSFVLAWLWNVAVLYLTMGFRRFSRHYTGIQLALRTDDVAEARRLLAEWRGRGADGLSSSEIAQLAIEEALCASHRHVFGVFVCFLLLPGPCGAVLYRVSASLADTWGGRDSAEDGDFGVFARRTFAIIDWLPVRLTAAAFAIVGDFEDAVYCWRTRADQWPGDGLGIVLASGAGALGVRLGMPVLDAGEITERAEIGTGEEADVDFMESTVGLIWRALVLWLLLLLLLGLPVW